MVDIRYLGLTVMSVFLALAVGIMIGSALGGPDRRDMAYRGLQDQFELLRDENQKVRNLNDRLERREQRLDEAIQELTPRLMRGRLAGSTVGVLLCGTVDEKLFWNRLDNSLSLAGATLGPVVRVPDRLPAVGTSDRRRLGRLCTGEDPPLEREDHEAAGWLVHLLARRHDRAELDDLCRSTGMAVRGSSDLVVRRLLVLTAADEERLPAVASGGIPELKIWDACRKLAVRAVIGEPNSGDGLLCRTLAQRGATVIDDVDRATGQLSLVLALAGVEGRFGSSTGASRPIPPVDSP